MPEIQRIPSELEVGVFSDNLLATQLDTQERIQSMFSDFNVPKVIDTPTVPKNLNTDEILKSQDLPKSQDYLTSDNPKLREIAKNAMAQDSANNTALTKGIGLPSMVPYQKGQEKFTSSRFGFNPYETIAQNEDFYHTNVWDKYSTVGKIWRGTLTFAGRVLTKFTTGMVGMVGDIGSMAWNGLQEISEAVGGPKNNFWADVSDNWLARKMEDADAYVKEQLLPTYKAINYDNKGAFSKVTDPYFWMNDLADGIGFLAQFAVPSMLFGKAALLGKAGKLGKFGQVMSSGVGELATASKVSKGIGKGLEFLTGSRNVGGITAHAFSTVMESVAEAKDGFKQTVDELVQKGYSEHEAKQIASENAPSQFLWNMAILTFSNALENKWFQQTVGNRISPTRSFVNKAGLVDTKPGNFVGNFFAKNKWGERIYFYGGRGAKASIMEGFWEENAQLAAQRSSRGEYTRRGDDTLSEGKREKSDGFFSQLIKQTQQAIKGNDKEASDSIMAGAVIGILGGTTFAKMSGSRNIPQVTADGTPMYDKDGKRVTKRSFLPEGERKMEKRENSELVAQVKNAQDAWLTIGTMPADIYNEDGTINDANAKKRVDEINEKLGKVSSVMKRKMTIDALTNQTEREAMQYLLFGDYVKAHILNGSGETLISRLKNWGGKSKDELAMYGVTEEVAENPVHWATVAQNMVDEYKTIDNIRYANNTNESASAYFEKERALKSLIFDYIASKQAALSTAGKYAELEAETNPFKGVDTFNSYNNLIAKREALTNTLAQPDIDKDSKEHFQKELDKTNQQIEMRKNTLPEHEKGKTSDMVFEKGSDINAQERAIMEDINDYLNYQYGKEDFMVAAEAFDKLIKDYSKPDTGIESWNKVVDYWTKASATRIRLAKLENLGYTEAEIINMPTAKQEEIVEKNIKKEEEKKPEEPPKTEQVPEPTIDDLKKELLPIIASFLPETTEENFDEIVDKVFEILQRNPNLSGVLSDEESVKLTGLITSYIQLRVAKTKDNLGKTEDPKDSKSETEIKETNEPENNLVFPSKENRTPKQQIQDLEDFRLAASEGLSEEEKDKLNKTIDEEIAKIKVRELESRRPNYIDFAKDKTTPLELLRNEAKREWNGISVITGHRILNLQTGIKYFVEAYPEYKELLDKFIQSEDGRAVGITNNDLTYLINTLKKAGINNESDLAGKINDKYDAELAALENTKEVKKADIEKRRQEELNKYEGRRANAFVKYNPEGSNTELTQDEIDEIELIINKASEKGWNVDRLQQTLANRGYVHSIGNSVTALRNFLQARLNGEINYQVNGNFLNEINAKYDAELAALDNNPIVNNPVVELVAGIATVVPTDILDEVREAYRMHQQALEENVDFKEIAEREGQRIHNNRIDNHVDGAKNTGAISIVTSNPKELVNDQLKLADNNLSRFKFMDNLLSGVLNRDDYKMILSLSEKNNTIFGIVGDKNGRVVIFDQDGMPNTGGLPILFYLDYDMFTRPNIDKRRSDVVKPPFPLAPLTATPIELHPSFTDVDVIAMLKDRIRRTTVTASLDFVTQGLLFRDGTNNSYDKIPKNAPTHTATELWGKRHMREEKGEIPLDNMIINGVYRRAHRIQFSLLRDLNDKNAGAETVEFRALSLGELTNEEGQNIFDILKTEDGTNFFQAAIEGNLPATKENLTTLNSLLRPDKFLVLNLGANILIVNLKKFKKLLASDNISIEELRSLTTIDDLKNSEFNITKAFYDNETEVELLSGILSEGNDNYARFVNRNVVTSAKPLTKGNTEGYSRINKRIALTLDENIDDMIKIENQRNQENKSPDVTEVTITDEFTDAEKKAIMKIQPEEEQNLDDDFTKTDC